MYDVNVNEPFKHLQCLQPHFAKNKSGHIVGIPSVQGKLATANRSSYAATKHAFPGILDTLRSELYDDGVKVATSYVRTNVSKNALGAETGETFRAID
jgi:dehydrogenase/reductase SDR family protein 7B